MNQPRSGGRRVPGEFDRARAAAAHADIESQVQAARTVAGHAVDVEDCRELLAMLGLRDLDGVRPRRPAVAQTAADGATALGSGLAGYLGAVARALGVSAGDASFEVSDTATAHLALARKSARGPDRDLMLLWSEQRGWSVSIAARPADPAVLARLGGDLVPAPHMVASFVRAVLAGHGAPTVRTIVPMPRDRHELAARMRAHVAD